jgi:tetratricopeptide (TPR) repeat protein
METTHVPARFAQRILVRGRPTLCGRNENVSQQTELYRLELLDGVDRGRYGEALAFVDTEPEVPASIDDLLLRAEIALYRDRFDEASAFLARLDGADLWLDDEGVTGRRARRARLLMVELACFTEDQHNAERLLRPVVEASLQSGDPQSRVRALYDAARVARHRANWTLAIDRLERALDLAREIGNRCYEGRVSYTLGYCWYYLNRLDLAEPCLQSALTLLTETENLRFRAAVDIFYGCLLCDRGDLKAALELLQRAERTVADLGVVSDMLTARMNAARTKLALGRYEEAERDLTVLLESEREPGTMGIEQMTLRLLAITQCVRGRAGEARRSADEALRLAEIGGNDVDRLEARLLVARARSLAGEPEAVGELQALVAETDTQDSPYLQAEARIYLARALLAVDATEAKALCDAARAMPVIERFYWLQREIEVVERDLRYAPVRVTPEGQFVMDYRLGWPDLKSAREAAERYWFEHALAETDGNITAAGRLLGLTKNEALYLFHLVVRGEPPRPSRSKNPDATAKEGRRRPKART